MGFENNSVGAMCAPTRRRILQPAGASALIPSVAFAQDYPDSARAPLDPIPMQRAVMLKSSWRLPQMSC